MASSLPGNPVGFRARYRLCDWEARRFGEARARALDTFRIATRPAEYYTQFIHTEDGIIVKASDKVAPEALIKAGDVITMMTLAIRNDIRACLRKKGAAMAILPEGEYVVALPEFAYLKGKTAPHSDTPFETYTGGLGAVEGQPVPATTEGDLLYFYEYQPLPHITMHEFAHAIMNLCFTWRDAEEWSALYADALEANVFPGTYAMINEREFFAQLSVAYFNVSDAIRVGVHVSQVQDRLRTALPETFAFLERIYGEAPTPRPLTFHRVENQDGKYAYSIEIPDDWMKLESEYGEEYEHFNGSLRVNTYELGVGTTLEQHAESRRDRLRRYGAGQSLFEITSFKRIRLGDIDAYSIAYRYQDKLEQAIWDTVELVVVAASLPGAPVAFGVIHWLAEHEATPTIYGELRTRALDSFRVFEK